MTNPKPIRSLNKTLFCSKQLVLSGQLFHILKIHLQGQVCCILCCKCGLCWPNDSSFVVNILHIGVQEVIKDHDSC